MILDCAIDKQEMLLLLGNRPAAAQDAFLEDVDDAIRRCEQSCQVTGVFRQVAVECLDDDAIHLFSDEKRASSLGEAVWHTACDFTITSSALAHHIQGAESVILTAITLGLQSEQWLRTERLKALSESLLSDAAASALAEAGADALESIIRYELTKQHCFLGSRFSPGYGDLSLATQRPLLDALNAENSLGIHLNEDDVMVPTKSITAIAGVFDAQGILKADALDKTNDQSSCAHCIHKSHCVSLSEGRTCRDL